MRLRIVVAAVVALTLSAGVGVWAADDAKSALVLHLTFDEGMGAVAKDSSPSGNEAVLEGTATWVDGKMGKALGLDGKASYADVKNLKGVDFDKSFTLMAWVKFAAEQQGKHHHTVITNLRDLRNRKGFAVFEESGHGHRINVYRSLSDKSNKQANYETAGPNFFDEDQWVHMAVVADFESDALIVYKNGEKAKLTSKQDVSKNVWGHGTLLRIGAESVGTKYPYHMAGAVDDVRIYQKALTQEEVQGVCGAAKK